MKKIVFILMAGYILILPIPHTTTIRDTLFVLLITTNLFYYFKRKEKIDIPLIKPWLFYLLISIISLFYAINKAYSINEIKKEIIYSLIIIWIVASWIKNKKDFLWVIKILFIGNILLVSIAIINGVPLLFNPNENLLQFAPLEIGVGNFSSYIILIIPFIFVQAIFYLRINLNKALLLFLLLFLNLIALYLTGNRMAWFAVLIQSFLCIHLLKHYEIIKLTKKIIFGFGILLLTIIILNFITLKNKSSDFIPVNNNYSQAKVLYKIQNSFLGDPRIKIWRVALKNIKENPLSGGGFGREAFKLLNPDFVKTQSFSWHAHNMFLNKGVQMGIPGIIVFIVLFIIPIKKLSDICKRIKNKEFIIYPIAGIIMIAGVIVKNMTDDFLVRDHAWLFWIITTSIIKSFENRNK